MKVLALFTAILTIWSSSLAQQQPSVFVEVSWDMSWHRLCYFLDFFAKELSEELFEIKGKFPEQIEPTRIRFINSDRRCNGKEDGEDAVLDLFVSKMGSSDVDRNLTIFAYRILYDYWKNKKMVLLDEIFIGKVNKVKLLGKDKPDIPEYMAESTRIAIAVAVGLAIVFLVASICTCVNLKKKQKKRHQGPRSSEPLPIEPPAYDYPEGYDYDGREEFYVGNGFRRPDARYNGHTSHHVVDDEGALGKGVANDVGSRGMSFQMTSNCCTI